jgi:hypothetical protein
VESVEVIVVVNGIDVVVSVDTLTVRRAVDLMHTRRVPDTSSTPSCSHVRGLETGMYRGRNFGCNFGLGASSGSEPRITACHSNLYGTL